MTERCKNIQDSIKEFEESKGSNVSIGTQLVWQQYFSEPFTDEEKEFCETLGYRYLGQGKFSGAFGITDHEFEYIGATTP